MSVPTMMLQIAAAAPHPLSGTVAELVWLLPVLPAIGALINGGISLRSARSGGGNSGGSGSAATTLPSIVAPLFVILPFLLASAMFMAMREAAPTEPFILTVASWMPAGELQINWGFQLDQLSMLMVLVITGVGSLIHLFSIGYMKGDAGYARYFAYLNMFVAFMLILVLGSNYPMVFVGWEGVALSSYLLIGFWFSEKANADAGKKSFIVNRIGDFGLLVAMFLIWTTAGSLDFVEAHGALGLLASGTPVLVAIALFLFLGATGKSAQIPLYIWLPDAMAGPTPVSALIHAATMVTAGVYLVARAAPVFALAPVASLVVASVGAITALFAATIALRQWDIKRVLAYSTVSQLGYMFIGVGTGAYAAGVFHLVTHAFFKALLFLGAGAVIHALHAAYHSTHRDGEDAQDLRNMGGLARFMPTTATMMAFATLAIVGVFPFSGFFSKDTILAETWARAGGSPLASASLIGISGSTLLYGIYVIGTITAFLTAIYMTRMMVLAFTGHNRTGSAEQKSLREAPAVMLVPLLILGVLSAVGGWLNLPALIRLGPTELMSGWLEPVTGASNIALGGGAHLSHSVEYVLIGVATAVALIGILIGWVANRSPIADKASSPPDTGIAATLANAYGVDALLDRVVLAPLNAFTTTVLGRGTERGLGKLFDGSGTMLTRAAGRIGASLQDGDVGKYAWVLAVGAIAMLAALRFVS